MSYQQDPDYIEVPERIIEFYKKYPDGRITGTDMPYSITIGGQEFVVFHAQAYRTPDDTRPGDGWAWEPVPGTTPFTKNSELMNAQTAAIGRAIVGIGLLASRKIASAEEVKARKAEQEQAKKPAEKKGGSGKNGKLPAKDVKALETAVRSWLKDNPDLRDMFQLKVVDLGVSDPNQDLTDMLSELGSDGTKLTPKDAALELMGWLAENDKGFVEE